MVFSSYLFIFFFLPLALLGYYAAPKKLRHLTLSLFSYIFYGWANLWFCLLMLFNTSVDYTNGRLMGASRTEPLKNHYCFGNRLDIRSMPAIVSINIYTYHVNQNSPVPRGQGTPSPSWRSAYHQFSWWF